MQYVVIAIRSPSFEAEGPIDSLWHTGPEPGPSVARNVHTRQPSVEPGAPTGGK